MKSRIVLAKDFCSTVTDGTHDTPKETTIGKYLITSKHVNYYNLDFDSAYKISDFDYDKINERSKVDQFDILFSMIGTLGRFYQEINIPNYAIKNVCLFKFNGDYLKSTWFKYYLLTTDAKEYFDSQERGTTQKFLSLDVLRKFPIKVFDDKYMDKVVKILDTIDLKIRLNQKINDYLLNLLQLEYHKIKCEYSDDYQLDELCEIKKNRASSENLTLDNYFSTENMLPNKEGVVPAATLPSDGKATICNPGDVLISNIRPYFKKIHYCTELSGCSADVLCFSAKEMVNSPYLYSILYTDEFFDYVAAGSKGTKMPRGDKDQIMEYSIPIPPEDVLKDFNSYGNSILAMVSKNNHQNTMLKELRDTLLPKLMSGEIDASKLELNS